MDKFIYAAGTVDSLEVKSISATDFNDAKSRIIRRYWDKYDDLKRKNGINSLTNCMISTIL